MKLDSIKVFVVGNPPPGFGGRYFVFLKLRTACGMEGLFNVMVKLTGTSCALHYFVFTYILISPYSRCHAVAIDSLSVRAFPSLP